MRADRVSSAVCDYLDLVKAQEIMREEASLKALESGIRLANKIPKKKLSWGAWELSIPTLEYRKLLASDPELEAPDRETKDRAWKRLYKSRVANHYRAH